MGNEYLKASDRENINIFVSHNSGKYTRLLHQKWSRTSFVQERQKLFLSQRGLLPTRIHT